MTPPVRAPRRAPSAARPDPRPRPAARAAAHAATRATRPTRAAGAATATAAAARAPKRVPRSAPPALEVVHTPKPRRTLRLLGGLAVTLLFASLLGLAVFHSMLVQGQLGLDRTEAEIEQEQMRQRELREQVASLAAPDRIVAEAVARGMVQPETRAYLPAVVPGLAVVPPPSAEASAGDGE